MKERRIQSARYVELMHSPPPAPHPPAPAACRRTTRRKDWHTVEKAAGMVALPKVTMSRAQRMAETGNSGAITVPTMPAALAAIHSGASNTLE